MITRVVRGLLLSCVAVAGCDSPPPSADAGADATPAVDAPADAGPTGAVARFAPALGPMAFGDVPFPSDLHLGADGTYELASLPTTARAARIDALAEAVRRQTGACLTCGMHLYVDGALDPASVPASPPSDASAPIVLVDVDPASPERGRFLPIEVQWRATTGLLSIRPAPEVTLRRNRRYAVAITSALRGADGTPLAATDAFVAVRDGAMSADPAVVRARDAMDAGLEALAEAGVARESLVAASVFTTHDPTRLALEVRALVRSGAAPVASVERVYPDATTSLDDLLGVPVGGATGLDVPDVGGVEGEVGMRHDTTSRIVLGTFAAPRLVEGTGSEVGPLRRASDGTLEATGVEAIPFVLVVPEGADLASLPVVIAAHGSPRTMEDALVLADTVGQHGLAVLGFDAFQFGRRASTAVDARLVRHRAGADGIYEHDRNAVQLRVANFQGPPAGLEASAPYYEGFFTQTLADALSVVRLAAEGDVSAIADADPALAGLAFDRDAIFYFGNSFGTIAEAGVVAVEPEVDAAIFNVPPSSHMETITASALGRSLVEAGFLPLYGIRGPFDEVTRRLAFEPMLDLIGWVLEGTDPRALAAHQLREPVVDGARPDVLIQLAELDEFVANVGAQATAAAMGVERVGPFALVDGVPPATLPVSANVTTPTGAVTGLVHLYEGAGHGMTAWSSVTVSFEAPIVPPFVALDPPRTLTNPIDAVHAEIAEFLATRLSTGRARLE